VLTPEDRTSLIRPLALVLLIAMIAFWDRSPSPKVDIPVAPAAQDEPAALHLSGSERMAADEQCSRKSREEFRRAWNEGTVSTANGQETAAFTHHYNEKLRVCFYELAVVRRMPTQAGDATPLRKMLFDINEGELYGEYQGPNSGIPKVCQVASLYCASLNEWDRLAEQFMETKAVTQ